MLSPLNLLNSVLVLLALVITGAVVTGRIRHGARILMWSGIAVLGLNQFSGLLSVAIMLGHLHFFNYQWVGVVSVLLTIVGVVLLLLAVGRAAREGQPSGPRAPQYPLQGGGYPPHPGTQPYGSDQAYGRPQPFDQPGTWGDQQRPR